MTLEQALQLQKGDHVIHRATAVSWQPMPVTEVWINPTRTIVRFLANKIKKDHWFDPVEGGFELPEKGKVWCDLPRHLRWEWSADHRRDHPEYYHAKRKAVARSRGAR